MAKASDPPTAEQIQAEIEQTRAELAATLDTLVDKVSPKRVAGRGVAKVKDTVGTVVDSVRPDHGLDPLADEAGLGTYSSSRSVRWERVAAAGAALVVVLLVVRRRRHR